MPNRGKALFSPRPGWWGGVTFAARRLREELCPLAFSNPRCLNARPFAKDAGWRQVLTALLLVINDYTGLTRKKQKKETTVTSSCQWNNNSRGRQDDASIAWPSAICGGRHRTRPGPDNDGASLVHKAPVAERATGEEPTALAIGPRDPERV